MNKYLKNTLSLAIPIIISHFIEVLYLFLNAMFTAKLGTKALAASALTTTTFIALMGFGWGVNTAVGILAAQAIGRGEKYSSAIYLKAGYICSLVVSAIIIFCFYNFDKIWELLGQDSDVAELAYLYLLSYSLCVIPDNLKHVLFQYYINFNKTRVAIIIHLCGLPLLYFLNSSLIWGNYGFPELGIVGIGISIAIIYILMFLLMLVYGFCDQELKLLFLFKHSWVKIASVVKEIFKHGIPIGAMFMFEILFFTIIALMIGSKSSDALAAYQINAQWFNMFVIIAYGYAEAVNIHVARSYGSKKFIEINKYSVVTIILTFICVGLCVLSFVLIPKTLIAYDIDINDTKNIYVIDFAVQFFKWFALYIMVDCIRIIYAGTLRGVNKSQFPMWSTLICLHFVGMPLSYYLTYIMNLGLFGIMCGSIIAITLNSTLIYFKASNEMQKLCQEI